MDGIINLLKPPGMTSHDAVQFIRRITGIRKVGHTGTLDPGVSGVLPICIGKGTRVAEFLSGDIKSYRGILKLGITTTSQDSFGETIEVKSAEQITKDAILTSIAKFTGPIEQTPPMVSAVKINGRKLYELARQGIEVERKARPVTIMKFVPVKYGTLGVKHPEIMFDIVCSKGTYIRTLFHDVGEDLGCGGHMSWLVRIGSGPFKISDAWTVEELSELAKSDKLTTILQPIDAAIPDMPVVSVRESAVKSVLNGSKLYPQGTEQIDANLTTGLVRLKDDSGRLLAIANASIEKTEKGERWIFQPAKVF